MLQTALSDEDLETRQVGLELVAELAAREQSAQSRAWLQLMLHMTMQQLEDPDESSKLLRATK